MIELTTQELMVKGMDELPAGMQARQEVDRFRNIQERALIATGLHLTYDKPRPGVADAFEVGIDDIRAANPGVNIKPHPAGGIVADVPSLKYPVTPPRPTTLHTTTPAEPGARYEWPDSLKLENFPFTPAEAVHAMECDCEDGDHEGGHMPPDDEPVNGAADGYQTRQDLEDRLRIIADIIDGQPSFGTDLANFKRRLQRVLG